MISNQILQNTINTIELEKQDGSIIQYEAQDYLVIKDDNAYLQITIFNSTDNIINTLRLYNHNNDLLATKNIKLPPHSLANLSIKIDIIEE